MRRMLFLPAVLLLAAPAEAQIGKQILLRAGTPEDRLMTDITQAADPAKKLELLEKFMQEFGQGEMAILAFEQYMALYSAEKNYDKAFEYGEKLLALDADNLSCAVNLMRFAQEKGDLEKMFGYGETAGAILQRYKAAPPPADISAESWQRQKSETLEQYADVINFAEYSLFQAAYKSQEPLRRAALFERFLRAFPASPYAGPAQSLVAAAFQQAQDYAKMQAFAAGVLAREPDNVGMLLLLADSLSERGQQLDEAEKYARRALEALPRAQKPAQASDEEWQKQKMIQEGIAHSSLGQVFINRNQLPQAEAEFRAAGPLLKADPNSYGRNLYRLGFTLARAKKIAEARTVLTEAVNAKTPYSPLAQETLAKLGPAASAKKKRP
jgi:tetratricopeptide (TPR) repeat protein